MAQLPPLTKPTSEGAATSLLGVLAALGTVLYGVAAARYLWLYRGRLGLLPASVIACFVLLAEAMIGVAVTAERSWHASWWEWHGLIVTAYLLVFFAARREWRDERFRHLYLSTTRDCPQEVSVLSQYDGRGPAAGRRAPAPVVPGLRRARYRPVLPPPHRRATASGALPSRGASRRAQLAGVVGRPAAA